MVWEMQILAEYAEEKAVIPSLFSILANAAEASNMSTRTA